MLTRRALVAAATAGGALAQTTAANAAPAKAHFAAMPFTHLDAGSTHPMPLGARAALEEYLRYKTQDGSVPAAYSVSAKERSMIARFGAMVGAAPDELSLVQSTTMGENLVIQALGIPDDGGRIVTDALHFFGSFYTYGELAKAGMDVVTLPMTREGRIDMGQMAAAVNNRTRLVSISAVSTTNGFQHDLKQVCDLAHAHGAYVYVDMVHAAGITPLDLRATGVDFAAGSSYKWLMGDFGLGFLYVRKEIQDKVKRPWWGYHQVSAFKSHVFPYDPPGAAVATYETSPDAAGKFAMGTTSWTGVVQLDYSLGLLAQLGVPAIETARQPMIAGIQGELRRRGYEPLTPLDSRTALVAFALKDARAKLGDLLKAANIRLTVSQNRFRVSLAAFNDMNDVDRLLSTLPRTPPA
jgi:selenocysteine lyase/cysteine desulfurase